MLWLFAPFAASFVAAVVVIQVLRGITSPFFTVLSRLTSKPRRSSESGR